MTFIDGRIPAQTFAWIFMATRPGPTRCFFRWEPPHGAEGMPGQFAEKHHGLTHIFYATTPPGPIVNMLKIGGLQLGNLIIKINPHVFISPPNILDGLIDQEVMTAHAPFIMNRGNVLLVRKGNPKRITQAAGYHG